MGGKSSTVSTSDPKLGTLRIQTSMVGVAQPLLWGQPRVTGNLVWFGGFRSEAVTTSTTSGGKGGGGGVRQERTSYRYFADVIMALGRGPILGIASAWKGKLRISGQSVAAAVQSLPHTATVPVGGVVTVPLAGGTFGQDVSVITPDIGTYFDTGDASAILVPNTLRPGTDYTRSGATYTFNTALVPVGATVVFNYTVNTAASWNSALAQLGMELATGTVGQSVWSYLQTNYPAQALAYSGAAYVRAIKYELPADAVPENHSFEVVTAYQVGSGVVDAWAHDVVNTFLTHPHWGLGWKASRLDLTEFTSYCRALPLYISPAMTSQRPAREWLQDLADLGNSMWVWESGKLRLVPRQDAAISSSFGSYTPNTTPEFDLEYGDNANGFLLGPVEVEPLENADVRNIVRAQWTNRANNYNEDLMDAQDAAHIQQFGERPSDVKSALAVHDPNVIQRVLQRWLQREVTVLNKYKFAVPYARCLMQLGSLQTLTDPTNDLFRRPVRITKRSEGGNNRYEYEAEDAPIGSASAPLYGQQAGQGFAHDFNAAPPNTLTPVIFEMHPYSSDTGLEIAVAATGPANSNWGSCTVWASIDGVNYERWGVIEGGSRVGTITAALSAAGTTVPVLFAGKGAELLPASANAADTNQSLCWIGDAATGEFVNYEGATLTGANAYNLAGLRRGRFDNTALAFANGKSFVRVDDDARLARSGALERSLIGKTIQIKLTSRNVYNGAEQSLADVAATNYTISGYQFSLPPPPPVSYTVTAMPDGARKHTVVMPAVLPRDYKGVRFAYNDGATAVPWASQFLVTSELFPVGAEQGGQTIEFFTPGPGAGVKSFRVRGVDQWGNQSTTEAVAANVDLPAPPNGYSISQNRLRNSNWSTNTSANTTAQNLLRWNVAWNLSSAPALIGRGDVNWNLSGLSGCYTADNTNVGGGSFTDISQSFLTYAGEPLEFSVYAAPHRCQAALICVFKDSGGGVLAATVVDSFNIGLGARANAPISPANRLFGTLTAPAGSVTCEYVLRKYSTNTGGADSYCFWDRAYAGRAPAGVTRDSATPWQEGFMDAIPGPADVDTPQIVPGAATDPASTFSASLVRNWNSPSGPLITFPTNPNVLTDTPEFSQSRTVDYAGTIEYTFSTFGEVTQEGMGCAACYAIVKNGVSVGESAWGLVIDGQPVNSRPKFGGRSAFFNVDVVPGDVVIAKVYLTGYGLQPNSSTGATVTWRNTTIRRAGIKR